jgi:glyoxylase-like metal-dependent hydrolase (beta-lactamase superfamily II)
MKALDSIRFGLPTVAMCLAAGVAAAQQDFSNVQIKVTKVAGTVYMLEGSGGNIAVCAGDDGIVIVDDQFAPLAPKIKEALKGISDKPIKFVLNTHFHGDHTGGNAEFGKTATIIAHDNVRRRLEAGGTVRGTPVKPSPREALPVVTFSDRASVHVNGEDILAVHIPHGHTDGDSVIYFRQSNVLHAGDDFVTYGFPFVDTGSGGSISGLIAGLRKAIDLVPDDVKVIPGHGPLSTREDVDKFIKMMEDTRGLVAEALKQGKTADQMKQDHLLAKWEPQNSGSVKTEAWIDQLIADVKNPPAGPDTAK